MRSWIMRPIRLAIAGGSFLSIVLASCTPVATAPRSEILPDGLTLDIGEFPDDTSDPDSPAGRPFDTATERACVAGGALTHGFHRLLDRGLGLAAVINNDATDPNSPYVQGTINTTAGPVSYKADFSPFDMDGDGVADGSGRWDTAPLAIRMWVIDDTGTVQRFIAALITARPTSLNAGAGSMYMQPGVVHPNVNDDFRIYVQWDRTDATYRWNQAHTVGTIRGNIAVSAAHHLVEHVLLADGTLQKTIRSTAEIASTDLDLLELRFSARTIVDAGVAVVKATGAGTASVSVENICIQTPTCDLLEAEACAGVTTADLAYLGTPTPEEADWPTAFPAEPTF